MFRVMLAASLSVILALSISGRPGFAQTGPDADPMIEILSIVHDPAGTISLGLRAEGARNAQIGQLTAFVNDIPTSIGQTADEVADDLALILTIDASGSMTGVPFAAAQQASRDLVSRLAIEDRVGVISFNDRAALQMTLTADHSAVLDVINSVAPQGSTALYDAVALSVETLSLASEKRRVTVLLSDGHDFGNVSSTDAGATIQKAQDAGVIVYTVGFGTDYDEEYLTTLAASTGGEFFAVHTMDDVGALSALFMQLGGALGSAATYTVPVRPLSLGTHRLNLRGVVNGSTVAVSTTFTVSNETLIQPRVALSSSDGTSAEIHLNPLIPPQDLTIEARVAGHAFTPSSRSSSVILLDFWRLPPGSHEVELLAFIGGRPGARAVVSIDVPALAPLLTVVERDGAMLARGNVQGQESPVVVLLQGGVEVGRSNGEMTASVGADSITFQLLDGQGRIMAVQEVPGIGEMPAASAISTSSPPLLLLIPVAGLTTGVGWWFLHRRRSAKSQAGTARARARAAIVNGPWTLPPVTQEPVHLLEHRSSEEVRPDPGAAAPDQMFGHIVVRDAQGHVQDVVLTRRPLTVGRAPDCDIVLDDPEIHPMHARIMVLSPTEVQVHALPDAGSRRYDHHEEDEWLVVHHGEHLLLGSSSLEVVLNEQGRVPDDDALASWERAGA